MEPTANQDLNNQQGSTQESVTGQDPNTNNPNFGNATSTTNAPITNEPELTGDAGTQNLNEAAQPQPTNLPKRIEGFDVRDEADADGNYVGERGNGLQLKDPVQPAEMRNAAFADDKIEERSVEELHEKFPATDIGPKIIPPYNPVPGLDEKYNEAAKKALEDFNNQNAVPEMGEANPNQTSGDVQRPIERTE